MSRTLLPIPAITVTGGTCQLPPVPGPGMAVQTGTVLDAVNGWRKQGAHVVYLIDGDAHAATGSNGAIIKDAIHHGHSVHFMVGGGVHDQETLDEALAVGPSRVVIDVATADRAWLYQAFAAHGQHVIAGLNVHGTDLVDPAGNVVADLWDTVLDLDDHGCPRFLVEEGTRRGHWHHKDKHVLAGVCESVRHPVMGQGGIDRLSDLHSLADLTKQGLEAVVMDEPLYSGRFTFDEAISATQPRFDPYEWAPPTP